jgi:glutamate 5-kinase
MKKQRIVVKLGTSTLTQGNVDLSVGHVLEIVRVMAALQKQGHEMILVSSGAMAAGLSLLGYPDVPKHMPAKQMLAAVGQSRLMELYSQLFGHYDLKVGQVLVTREDLTLRRRYLNARNTLLALIQYRVIPVINENDTISTEEIRLGDNDNLSALVANAIDADLLVLFTDQDGLFTADPRKDEQARHVEVVDTPEIPRDLWLAAGRSVSGLGTGGMATKLQAADLARRSGTSVIITNGCKPENLIKIAAGKKIGTYFPALCSNMESRKRYMLAEMQNSAGVIFIDEGAENALRQGGSLLSVGIRSVSGPFERGDTVVVRNLNDEWLGLGIVNYTYEEALKIEGRQSTEIEAILGYTYGGEVVHHKNLLLM